MKLTVEQQDRYARNMALAGIGEEGQRKLWESKVLLIGAGGLGSPIALYLAAAGVGTLGIVDGDVVDVSNLQRQILHSEQAVGTEKALSAQRRLQELNGGVTVVPYCEEATRSKSTIRITISSSTGRIISRLSSSSTTPASCCRSPFPTPASWRITGRS